MSQRTIGTCSICGGAVTVPSTWLGIIPPTPTCSQCGAVAANPHGPVIPMKPVRLDPWTVLPTRQPNPWTTEVKFGVDGGSG